MSPPALLEPKTKDGGAEMSVAPCKTKTQEYAIEVADVCKIFPGGVVANDNISLRVAKGHVHAVLGENGAGKTTLMNMLYGMIKPDKGEIRVFGEKVNFASPIDAIDAGIGMVHQHFMLVPSFTVAENIVLGREPRKTQVFFDEETAMNEVAELSERYGLNIHPEARVRDLSVGERQRVEIMKVLSRNVDIIILDEPTAVLTPQEVESLFMTFRALVFEGKTLILITHKLKEALSIADAITVLRGGKVQGTIKAKDATTDILTRMIVGEHEKTGRLERTAKRTGKPLLKARDVVVQDITGHTTVNGVSLDVREGEIVGVAGVEGNGQEELIEAIVGLRRITGGSVELGSVDITHKSTWFRREHGLSYVPSDRLEVGSAAEADIAENLVAGNHKREPFAHHNNISWRYVESYSEKMIKRYNIKATNPGVKVRTLSGGNLQRVVLARELGFDSEVIIVSQPTRGLDIRSANLVHQKLLDMRNNGAGILMVSSDLDEILAVSDRVIVMYEGKIVGEFDSSSCTLEEIGACMLGSTQSAQESYEPAN